MTKMAGDEILGTTKNGAVIARVDVQATLFKLAGNELARARRNAKARTDGIGVVVARGTVGTVRLTYNWRIKTYAIYDEMGTTVGQGALAQVTHALAKLFDEMTA